MGAVAVPENQRPSSFTPFYEEARACLLPRLRAATSANIAEDAFHEAMLVVYDRWPEVTVLDNPLGWAWTVARRIAARQMWRERRRRHVEAFGSCSPVLNGEHESMLDLFHALDRLDPRHAAAFRLTQLDQIDVASTSSRLGVPTGTVKVWVHRSRRQLAERTSGVAGLWVAEEAVTPASVEMSIKARGHADHADAAMESILIDRPLRWVLEIAGGRYWHGTDDGDRMDFGDAAFTPGRLTTKSIAAFDWVEGARVPIALGSMTGTSVQHVEIDGDRMRVRLLQTQIQPTNGVPDTVFREVFWHEVVYRWTAHLTALPAGGSRASRHPGP